MFSIELEGSTKSHPLKEDEPTKKVDNDNMSYEIEKETFQGIPILLLDLIFKYIHLEKKYVKWRCQAKVKHQNTCFVCKANAYDFIDDVMMQNRIESKDQLTQNRKKVQRAFC